MLAEVLLVVICIAVVGVIGIITQTASPLLLIQAGFWGLGLGLLVGLPTGFWYHYRLYEALGTRGAVPGRWWLSPSDFHSSLAPEQWGGIRPWYLLGVAAFTFSFGGGLIALAGLLLLG